MPYRRIGFSNRLFVYLFVFLSFLIGNTSVFLVSRGEVTVRQDLENDQINRLWEHGTHEDTIFYNMLNFFLVFESVLLGVVGLLYSKTASPEPVLKIIGALGLSVTLVWEYAQIKQRRYIKIISARAQNWTLIMSYWCKSVEKASGPFL